MSCARKLSFKSALSNDTRTGRLGTRISSHPGQTSRGPPLGNTARPTPPVPQPRTKLTWSFEWLSRAEVTLWGCAPPHAEHLPMTTQDQPAGVLRSAALRAGCERDLWRAHNKNGREGRTDSSEGLRKRPQCVAITWRDDVRAHLSSQIARKERLPTSPGKPKAHRSGGLSGGLLPKVVITY